jgi:outer membrane protein assembly factor BamB
MEIIEKERKKSNSGIMTKLLVYEGEALVGNGWVIFHNGRNSAPTLISLNGKPLEVGWYNLVAIEQQLVVINKTVQ